MLKQIMHFGLISKLIFLSFKANAKTGIAGVRHLNVWVTALDIMFHGWLETARNHAISVNFLVLDQEVN